METLATRATTADDAALLAGVQAGDPQACEDLVRRFGGRMLATARRLLANEEDARDAVQDAFLSAFRAVSRFEGRSQLGTWLHRIVVNAALAKLRKKEDHEDVSIDPWLPRFLPDGHAESPAGPWRDSPVDNLEREETRQAVRQAIDRLPVIYRTVLVMRDIEQLETAETARLLGVTAGVVKTRLHRAHQALRTLLDPRFRKEGA